MRKSYEKSNNYENMVLSMGGLENKLNGTKSLRLYLESRSDTERK